MASKKRLPDLGVIDWELSFQNIVEDWGRLEQDIREFIHDILEEMQEELAYAVARYLFLQSGKEVEKALLSLETLPPASWFADPTAFQKFIELLPKEVQDHAKSCEDFPGDYEDE